MTFEEFNKITDRKNAFDKYWNYSLAIAIGLFCIWSLFYVVSLKDDGGKPDTHFISILIQPNLLSVFRDTIMTEVG